ncbi:MAG: pyrroline-5-carboxylate reductase [Verrucomicrobiota bacterium]
MNIGFIGCGKMSSALVRGILKNGVSQPDKVWLSDHVEVAALSLGRETGSHVVKTNGEVVRACDVVLLCVKPGDAVAALEGVRSELAGKLVISIVAGLTIATLEGAAGREAKVIRVMPNTPALVHNGASAYALGTLATPGDGLFVEQLFGSVGFVGRVKEPLLDAVTGLSGSGPAYAYLMIEALSDGGVLMGLPRELSLRLAAQTLAGAAEMVLQTGAHPAVLRDAVTSPGGTTMAGLEVMEAAGIRSGLIGAVRAATERATELGKA